MGRLITPRRLLLLAVLVALGASFFYAMNDELSAKWRAKRASQSDAQVAELRSLVDRMVDGGILERIKASEKTPRIVTGPAWSLLPIADKQTCIAAVVLLESETGSAVVVDNNTGKEIGRYSQTTGLELR